MDAISSHTLAFLDLCGITAEGNRKVILMKVEEALANSQMAAMYKKLNVTFYGGPVADKIMGICLAEILNLHPDEEKIEFVTRDGVLSLPAYFKGLLEKDFSKQFKDPEKAERMKELTLKNQFRSVTKEAANLYLVARFGPQHLESIEEVSREVVFETVTHFHSSGFMNDSILSILKEMIEKLDPSKISDIRFLVKLVSSLKSPKEINSQLTQFFKTTFTHSKKYSRFDRFLKWLDQYLPGFISRAFNLLPTKDVKDLVAMLIPLGQGLFGIDFPFAIPDKRGLIFELEPIKNRITSLDLSAFKELSPAEKEYLSTFKNLRELKLNSVKLEEPLNEVKIVYDTEPAPKPSADAEKGAADASARDGEQAAAPQANSAPPAADA